MTKQLKTDDHPQANGRKAKVGEQQWTFIFKMEDGSELQILAGANTREAFKAMLEQEEIDDLAASQVSGN